MTPVAMQRRHERFSTLPGMKRWAARHGLEVVPEPVGFYWSWHSVTTEHGLLSVAFDKETGKLYDCTLHAKHMSHGLGSNSLSTLLRMTRTGRPT